ncbi:MAG: NusG antitermination factor [Verrucomicrobiales bacterium]|nr:NusG antitermination factor [Verrucomicrobiales bacterium]
MDGEIRFVQVRSFAFLQAVSISILSRNDQSMHAPEVAWFCIRSRPKHEHIAAAHLRQLPGVEVFNPRLKFLRSTRRGRALVTESLFPNYLFARFVLNAALERVRHAAGVNTVVRFGDRIPAIPHEVIEALRSSLAHVTDRVFSDAPAEGDEVEIMHGPFHGEKALVTRVFPARQRVQVLLDVLGRSTALELSLQSVSCQAQPPANLLLAAGRIT